MLKSLKSKRTETAIKLGSFAVRRIALSGTPALSRPAELFSQIRVIEPKLFSNWRKFADRYCEAKFGRFGFEAKGAANLEELSAILHNHIMIRLVNYFSKLSLKLFLDA
jgi:SWI/SNF-related matrix-associated actin-dependent regulator 1 of chromatin subfamily A